MPLPDADQVEVTIFGPGYGECCLIHVGDGQWVIIDSCISSESNEPAALEYLRSLGVDVTHNVKLIIASHWHDDHIRGLAKLVGECTDAQFCCSAALGKDEFLARIIPYVERHRLSSHRMRSGVSEIYEVLRRGKNVKNAVADKRLLMLPPTRASAGANCEVWALSPSDKQFQKFLGEIGDLIPQLDSVKARVPDQSPNYLSVVIWISVGDINILFGGDLEETGDKDLGWSVIVSSKERPQGKATVFKVPHHGSQNAHKDEVWDNMLIAQPFAVLAPYNRGTKLPTRNDVARILARTDQAYSTSTGRITRKSEKRRSPAVQKQIDLKARHFGRALETTGAVCVRNGGAANHDKWTVTLIADACHLSKLAT